MKKTGLSGFNVNPSENTQQKPLPACIREMRGLSDLGMKQEVLDYARTLLTQDRMTWHALDAAWEGISIHADSTNEWAPMMQAAYDRLSKRDQRVMRRLMLELHNCTHQHEEAIKFIPKRFNNYLDLFWAMDTLLALDRLQEAKPLAKKCAQWLKTCDDDFNTGLFLGALADYHARVGNWVLAETLLRRLKGNPVMAEDSILGLVRLHLAQTLAAVNWGKKALKHLKNSYDPEGELSVPGNDAARWKEIEAELARYQEELEKILPKEDQKDFGLGDVESAERDRLGSL